MNTEKQNRKNQDIQAPELRVIGDDGEMLGILRRDAALRLAEEAGLDLVEIQPHAEPPVCRIMDFGKFRFEMHKKASEAKKKQRQVEVKEIKFRPTTDVGDYAVKLRHLREFLDAGHKVKITIFFKGREITHAELGHAMAQRLEADLAHEASIDQRAKLEGKQMTMMVSAKKSIKPASTVPLPA